MREHFTEAFVLNNKDLGELDSLITLYTADFGKVIAKTKSSKKITSKLVGHLQPLNFANVRLIEKNSLLAGRQGFQIIDALTNYENKIPTTDMHHLKKNLNVAEFINEMTYELQQDSRLWEAIKKIFASNLEEKIIYRGLLKILGFGPEFATCAFCHKNEAKFFIKTEHSFLCQNCGQGNLKISQNEVVSI
ncbi:DNA repair protein RecO [Candidatus Wolfebacteria bacterium]|nr:DNA repair protein RecO [Candidatus Wolfebacteria bacterium]